MKLLIITQKVDRNDPILGFFHRWVLEFSKHFESVIVICLEEGEHQLPQNVRVLSLGKEKGCSRIQYILRFYKYIWNERKNYDCVFVHMNQVYVILGGMLWRFWGKKTSLWYTHKSVSFSLRVAEKLVQKIFSASKESFRLPSNKLLITGHGIDTDFFIPSPDHSLVDPLQMITVGRIAPVKKIDSIIESVKLLGDNYNIKAKLTIVGGPVKLEDFKYQEKLKEFVKENNLESSVKFVGPVNQEGVLKCLQNSDLFVHVSETGSLDKAALEAMSCGLIVISSNDALRFILEPYGLVFDKDNASNLSEVLVRVTNMIKDEKQIGEILRNIVIRNHSLRSLISLIAESLNE